ncbi:MAG: DUF1553 domain-containing protein [Verrucomicrobia bacterium]|nr:DUF1553 domain-containing protein [Verrucomicrobiota bacterium]
MKESSIWLLVLASVAFCSTSNAIQSPFESSAGLEPKTKIDELVFANLEKLQLEPSNLCSDAVFLRRAFLDVIGTLPTSQEANAFLRNRNPQKRSLLIDQLLEREEFADFWTMKWSDLLRVKAEFPINLWPNAAQAYHRWIRTSIKENKPYDKFVRELLTSSGSNFRTPQVNFYRALPSRDAQGIAQAVALTFMGARAEKWPREQLAGMGELFSQVGYKSTAEWKEEIIFFEPRGTNSSELSPKFTFPNGVAGSVPAERDPREVFADWLINKNNPWFARSFVNRAWSWFLGRGIVHEPDDLRADNPPSNPALLALLETEFVASHYDIKQFFRLILNSKTYQLSSIPKSDDTRSEIHFAHYPLRRLDAEVLIDALNQITGTTEKYSSSIPEPFTFIPEDQRSISLPDGSISSSFLELFGRPSRDTGLESERDNQITAGQRLHLLNSTHIQQKIEQSGFVRNATQSKGKAREMINEVYLAVLSRYPTEQELNIALDQSGKQKRETAVDLIWALVNSAEFLYRH